MDINDYLIDHSQFDWQKLFATWHWILPDKLKIWMMNRFGDLFLETDDGKIWCMRLDAGSLDCYAENKEDFCNKIDEGDNANDWLMIPLVDQLVEEGKTLKDGQCYSFQKLPILGGEYAVENVSILDVEFIYNALGPLHEQLKDIPDGTEIVFRPKSE